LIEINILIKLKMRRHIISEIGFTLYDGDEKSPVVMRKEKINCDSIEYYDFVMDAHRDFGNDEHYTKFGINITPFAI